MITLTRVRGGDRVACDDCGHHVTHRDVDTAIADYQNHKCTTRDRLRPCDRPSGRVVNVCVAEGCYNEACLRLPLREEVPS